MSANTHYFLRHSFSSYGTTAQHISSSETKTNSCFMVKVLYVILGIVLLFALVYSIGTVIKLCSSDNSNREAGYVTKSANARNNPRFFRETVDS
ncbi:hypothetical protein CAEBREN_08641 [Caenorhabditis brenneri]|uniref:Uncharacterized protein n=1 Tax=Caenorhabditis brenneri TaxID=135651 RepID=G0N4F2_CAEBE|nr:hypothetical protein CAEBREN_08641 [Caenorhabditis brenneri]